MRYWLQKIYIVTNVQVIII